eukprot:g14809.t1
MLKKQSQQSPNSDFPLVYRETKAAIIRGEIPSNLQKLRSEAAKLAVNGDSCAIRKARKRTCTLDPANKEN